MNNNYDLFDWNFYINYHSDLLKNNITTQKKALNHWINIGYKEKRIVKINNMIFYFKDYINSNPNIIYLYFINKSNKIIRIDESTDININNVDWFYYFLSNKNLHKLEYLNKNKLIEHFKIHKDIHNINSHFNLDFYNKTYNTNFKSTFKAIHYFLNNGIKLGHCFDYKSDYILKVILPTYNEFHLIEHWIKYYINLVGIHNIIIFDMNSDKSIQDIYNKYKNLIVIKVDEFFCTCKNKNSLFYPAIDFIKQYCKYITKVDTDEFICNYTFSNNEIFFYNNIKELLTKYNYKIICCYWLFNLQVKETFFSKNFNDYLYFSKSDIININNIKANNWIWGKKIVNSNIASYSLLTGGNHNLKDFSIITNFIIFHIMYNNLETRINKNINLLIHDNIISKNNIESDIKKNYYNHKNLQHGHKLVECYNYFFNPMVYHNQSVHKLSNVFHINYILLLIQNPSNYLSITINN